MPFTLTMGDYFLLDEDVQTHVEIIPPGFATDDLMPLPDYLAARPEDLLGKLPFLWVVDDAYTLRQAVVPFAWLERCKERLDHWQFIQELGGVNSYHVQRAIEQARAAWTAEKDAEIKAMRIDMDAEIDRIRKEEAGKAMERLADILLDLDSAVPSSPKPAQIAAAPKAEPESIQATQTPFAAPEPAPSETSSEVWVESWRCTSCNDCIQLLPSVFKYNSDKQAEVINPKAGTYAKIVTAAEKCPAKCIHPGMPQNPNEPGLDELIQRATALN
jgi:ferredoxin